MSINIQYWKVSYNLENRRVKYQINNIQDSLEKVNSGLIKLIKKYQNPDTPLIFYPDKRKSLVFDDYFHLARASR